MTWTPNLRMAVIALIVLAVDQGTKFAVMQWLAFREEFVVIEGFFRLVHWGNTGAAWSFFKGNNGILAIISMVALVVLYLSRRHFGAGTILGQVALGLLFGGIMGNLTDRLLASRRHVIDFLYFYVERRGGGELGFPAFNFADTAICIAVVLLFYHSLQGDQDDGPVTSVSQPT